jgi:hypothetical protein
MNVIPSTEVELFATITTISGVEIRQMKPTFICREELD